ncbi:uncharacterized protein LOC125755353 isoform X8 [Canis lupus dingo]|uniref:uncharacterized protein LOC125755353 isoform X8 n=1 Tax=Canis lupus dingo TaxID=286419 RepID=UPI0020C2A71B|nr:uncharacterized protein LOC125755353 isoform X8 [Canis lupus dingo]
MKRATDDMQTECEKERKTTIVSSLSASGKSSCQHSFHTQPQKIICDMVKGSRFGGRQIFLLNFCNLRHLTISQHHKKKAVSFYCIVSIILGFSYRVNTQISIAAQTDGSAPAGVLFTFLASKLKNYSA